MFCMEGCMHGAAAMAAAGGLLPALPDNTPDRLEAVIANLPRAEPLLLRNKQKPSKRTHHTSRSPSPTRVGRGYM